MNESDFENSVNTIHSFFGFDNKLHKETGRK